MPEATAQILANLFGLEFKTIHKLTQQGIVVRIGKPGENRYDPVQSTVNYVRHLREIASGRQTHDEGSVQRARWVREKANQAEFKTRMLAGEFVSRAEVLAVMDREYSGVKERLLTLPGKVSDRCVNRTRKEIFEILTAEIYEALEELSSSEFSEPNRDAG